MKNVLLRIVNGFIESGIIPDGLKTSIVKPHFKAGSASSIENYRPISILPGITQLLEKHMFLVMTDFLEKFDIMPPSQYGFIVRKGTQPLLENSAD